MYCASCTDIFSKSIPNDRDKGVTRMGRVLFEETSGASAGNRLSPVADVEFVINIVDVSFDGAGTDDQFLGDFGVREAGRDEAEYLQLARAERCRGRRRNDGERSP